MGWVRSHFTKEEREECLGGVWWEAPVRMGQPRRSKSPDTEHGLRRTPYLLAQRGSAKLGGRTCWGLSAAAGPGINRASRGKADGFTERSGDGESESERHRRGHGHGHGWEAWMAVVVAIAVAIADCCISSKSAEGGEHTECDSNTKVCMYILLIVK